MPTGTRLELAMLYRHHPAQASGVDAQEAHLASIWQKDAVVDDVDCNPDDCGPDDLTCAICLCQPEPVDLAIIKGCEHNYCGEQGREGGGGHAWR